MSDQDRAEQQNNVRTSLHDLQTNVLAPTFRTIDDLWHQAEKMTQLGSVLAEKPSAALVNEVWEYIEYLLKQVRGLEKTLENQKSEMQGIYNEVKKTF